MIGTDLGDLRRSHYSIELASLPEGTDVVVMGWVLTVRGHGNIAFATIRDKLGNCLLYTSPSPRDATLSRMPSSA